MTDENPCWPYTEITVPLEMRWSDDPVQQANLKKQMDDTYATLRRNMDRCMYAGDSVEVAPSPRTLRRRLRDLLERAHDAWLVLIGKADIG